MRNFTIFRLAYILGDPGVEDLIYNMPLDCNMEVLSAEDAGYVFVSAIDHKRKLNKKIYNVSGGEKFRTNYSDCLKHVFNTYGLSFKYVSSWLMAEKNYSGGVYVDGDELENILHFRSKNLSVYYNNTLAKYKHKKSRCLSRLMAKPFVYYLEKKK